MGNTIKRRVSVFDIKTPYHFTDDRFDRYINELKKYRDLLDETCAGEFIYRNSKGDRYAKYIRVKVDSRFISDDKFYKIMEKIFNVVK